jgi:ferritin
MVHGQITMDSAASQIFFSSCRGTKPYDENTGIHIKQRCKAIVTAIPAPTTDPISVNNCFEKVFEHEVDNTKSIYISGKMALDEEDWASWNFLQWFVKEQIEEENLASLYWIKLKL